MRSTLAALLVLAPVLAACGRGTSGEEQPPGLDAAADPGPDAGPSTPPGPDAGATSPDAGEGEPGPDAGPGEPATFTPEAASLGAGEVGLRAGAPLLSEGVVRLEIALGAHANVFGVAGVLRYDPQALEFLGIESTGELEGGEAGVVIGRASPAGRLVFAVTRKGPVPGQAIEAPRSVATLHLRARRAGETALSFEPQRCAVRNDALNPAAAAPAFRGGVLFVP